MNNEHMDWNDEVEAALSRLHRRQMFQKAEQALEHALTLVDDGDAGAAGSLLLATIDFKHAGYPPVRLPVTDHLALCLEVKAAHEDAGLVGGYLSTFENEDLGHDIIHQGAYRKTIDEASRFARTHNAAALWPLLWQHDKGEPIGGITSAKEDSHGLLIAAHLNMDIERGRQAYHGLKQGYLSFSIGYRPIRYEWKGNIRHLYEIALGEGSAVTWPMNPEARG